MNRLRALWLRWFPPPSRAWLMPITNNVQPTEICEAEWRTAIEATRVQWYQLGLAEGELRGRSKLATEIEAQFYPNSSQDMTADDATRIRHRQVH